MRLLLVGCGKMGGAMLRRIAAEKLATKIAVIDPAPSATRQPNLLQTPDKLDASFVPDCIVIAVKPQHVAEVLPHYTRFGSALFLSVMTGVTLSRMKELIGGDPAIIRAVPNLPASIGAGMSVAIANGKVGEAQRKTGESVLKTIGDIVWVEDEKLLDAVTALSGSGPGYVFALCEAMAKGGEALGLPRELAAKLARQTVIGSGAMLKQSGESAEALRLAVTSPGGTTEAALKVLLAKDGLSDLMRKVMTAALQRARQLA
jgi:pyrroline-5-carboxylate reductase